MGNDAELVKRKKREFMQRWECRDLPAQEFLGMHIRRDRSKRCLALDQSDYLKKIIKRFKLENARIAKTPLPTGYMPSKYNGPVDPKRRQEYQQVIGSLLYLSLGTRADISYAVAKMSQFSVNPSQDHLNRAYYIIRYLLGTAEYSLIYDGGSGEGFFANSDSDHASDPDSRRSQTGYVLKLAKGLVSWSSYLQKTVALTSTEAEYMALSDCCRQVRWIINLLGEIGFLRVRGSRWCDNMGS